MSSSIPVFDQMEFVDDTDSHPPEVNPFDLDGDMSSNHSEHSDDDRRSNVSNEDSAMANANEEYMQGHHVVETMEVAKQVPYDVTDASIDLEVYMAPYSSYAYMHRLKYIAEHSSTLKHDALFMLIKYVKEHCLDTKLYSRCVQRMAEGCQSMDKAWLEQTAKKAAVKREKLDQDLKHYRTNSIPDSIRRGLDDYAEHCVDMGELQEALKNFSRTRDYCSGAQNQVQMNLNVIRVSIYLNNWTLVQSYVQRAKSIMETGKLTPSSTNIRKPAVSKDVQAFIDRAWSQLHAATALVDMANGRYESAVQSFLNVSYDHLQYGSVLSERDVGVYTSLCALATCNREQLATQLINNSQFKQFIELEPRLLDAVRCFNSGDYNKCLTALQTLRPNLLLDVHCGRHIDSLYNMIRKRGMIAYMHPYSCAHMRAMAVAFNCANVEALEEELVQLIFDGEINGRIDSCNKLLYARAAPNLSCARALQASKQMVVHASLLALRQAIIRANVCVKAEKVPEKVKHSKQRVVKPKPAVQSTNKESGVEGGDVEMENVPALPPLDEHSQRLDSSPARP